MKKIKAVAMTASTAALLTTAFSGVASAHVHNATFLPLGTNLMVCTNHGEADLLLDGPVHRSWHAAAGECRTFRYLPAGEYQIGEQTEIDEPTEPCDAAPESGQPREHPGYPLCYDYGYYTHHIDVIRPGETGPATGFGGLYNNKYRPPVAPVHVNQFPFAGHGILGLSCLGPVAASNSNMPTGGATGKTCDPPATIPTGGNATDYGVSGTSSGVSGNTNPTGGSLNFTVVILQMHRATGHI